MKNLSNIFQNKKVRQTNDIYLFSYFLTLKAPIFQKDRFPDASN